MPRNQLLGFHCVGERQYDLTGLRTGSVRDQFVRAFSITHALLDDVEQIKNDDPDMGLLVLGAGVSGISCALVAALRGVRVTVIEKRDREFHTLSNAKSRRIAPFEYDWPRPKPNSSQFCPPWFPLQFSSNTAYRLAAQWQSALQLFLSSPNTLEILHGFNARNFVCTPFNGSVQVKGPWDGKNSARRTRHFGAVIACTGFMRERTLVRQMRRDVQHPDSNTTGLVQLRSFHGVRFWFDSDYLDHWKFNTRGRDTVKSVLVSGGGDGAMQDFQRAATRKFGLPLLEHLETCLGSPIADKYLVRLLAAEDRARRACAWGMSNPNDTAPDGEMQIWDATFRKVVDDVCEDYVESYGRRNQILDAAGENVDKVAAAKPAFEQLAQDLLRDDFKGEPFPTFVWVTREPHLGFAYALNRFLSLFLLKVLTEGFDAPQATLLFRESISQIVRDNASRDCCPARDCRGYTHHVSFGSDKHSYLSFQIIVIRHGLIFPVSPYLGKRAPVSEQMVPYFIPH